MAATNVQVFSGDIQLPIGSSLTTNINDTFTHDGEQMPHVGLQWRTHTDFPGGQVGQLSAYNGFKFFTGGTEKVTILDDGNVGIGTTDPSDSLHVSGQISTQNGNGNLPAVLFRSGASNTNSWEMKANISDSVAGIFTIDRLDAATKQKFVIKNDGNVGIGITNPSYNLDVNGSVGIRGYTYSRLFYSFQHTTGTISGGVNYDMNGGQFTSMSGTGSVDDGWYHAVAMRFDANPFERATCQVWYYGGFGPSGNAINVGVTLTDDTGNLRMITDGDAVSFPTPYLITLHKYGGRDWP